MSHSAFTRLLIVPYGLALLVVAGYVHGNEDRVWSPFADLLEQYVTEHRLEGGGLISSFDYRAALESEHAAQLNQAQRRRLAAFDPQQFETREHAIAFWINAYNFFMIAHILDNPHRGELIDSVRDYGSLFNPYRVFRRDLFDVGGTMHSLSGIENDILLGDDFKEKGWKDARVHFAVNCASVGCPPLRDHLYTADNVDVLLEENTRLSLKTPLHLRIEDDVLWLTSLFDWYEDHFVNMSGSVQDFIDDHVDESLRAAIEATDRIRFIDYDWDLNSPDNMARWTD